MHANSLLAAASCFLALASAVSAQTAVPPAPGELAVSEIMFTPICAGSQNTGEWFEVTNISTKVIDVNGLYFQDGAFPGASGAAAYFQVLPSVAVLPPLYPGERFLFCRSKDPLVNGGMTNVDYDYSQDFANPNAPADHSRVGFTKMNFSSQTIDGMHISLGAPAALGGTVIASASYNPIVAPFQLPYLGGGSAEMKNLFGTFQVNQITGANDPNVAQASTLATFGTCISSPDWGTPRGENSTDATVWPMYSYQNDTLNENVGTISITNPPSMGGPVMHLHMANGIANAFYSLGYCDALFELPFNLFVPGNPGAILLDLSTAGFLNSPSFIFDGSGNANFDLDLPVSPALLNQTFHLEWIAFDPIAFQLAASNVVTFTICD